MYKHPFRKSFGLIVLYSIIIIGIFVLQFRNESVVSKTIGLLSVSFAQKQNEDGTVSLKNSLQVSFKGISFTADEVQPLRLVVNTENGSSIENLSLVSYGQRSPLSYTFHFTRNVSLTFAASTAESESSFSITAELPPNSTGVYLNYKPTSGFSVTEKTKTKLILNSKNLTYAFTAAQIDDKTIFLSPQNLTSYYVAYDPSVEFTFATLDSDMIIAQKSTYESNIKNFRESLVSSVSSAIKANQAISEKSVVAYVSELALNGRYSEAIASIPDSFKKGNKRTYLSAPYFNTLESMYSTLEMYNGNMAEMLSAAFDSPSLSIFTVEGFADYLDTLPENPKIRALLAYPASVLENESESQQIKLSQASGILRTYLRLSSLHSNFADDLRGAAEKCLGIIEANCTLNDSILTLSEKGTNAENFLALATGNALIQWGEFNNESECLHAGYAIINSILSVNSLDAITAAEIYPVLISNPYYPHSKVLSRSAQNTIWAWTCAPSITYSTQNGTASIASSFIRNESHYIIVNGILPFSEIEIYGLSFHSDPRFEAYNSSGFIYREAKNALLLKSRHKSETETVRLTYR